MITRREAAVRLDIPPEMALRNGLPARMSEAALARLDADPPAWLAQSRANRTGGKPVWVQLICGVCGSSAMARPKKWWPDFTHLRCDTHGRDELPAVARGFVRGEYPGVGTHFIGILDEAVEP